MTDSLTNIYGSVIRFYLPMIFCLMQCVAHQNALLVWWIQYLSFLWFVTYISVGLCSGLLIHVKCCKRAWFFLGWWCMYMAVSQTLIDITSPDSKVHGAYVGPTRGRQDPGGPHVGPMIIAIWASYIWHKTIIKGKSYLASSCSYGIKAMEPPSKDCSACYKMYWHGRLPSLLYEVITC